MKYSCNEARESGVNLSWSDRQKLYNCIWYKKIRFLDTELSEIKNRAILHWPRFFLFSLSGKQNRTEQNQIYASKSGERLVCFGGGGRIVPVRRIVRWLVGFRRV